MRPGGIVRIGVVVTALAVIACGTRRSPESQDPPTAAQRATAAQEPSLTDPSALYFTTASESRSRSSRVLPNGPSEDARHVLGDPPIAPPRDDGPEEYAPDEQVEWYVAVTFPRGTTLEKRDIRRTFDPAWHHGHDSPAIFGRGASDGRWTYVVAADSPSLYTELRVSWRLVSLDGDPLRASAAANRLEAVARGARGLGSATTRPSLAPAEAELRANALAELLERFETSDVQVILAAADGETYDGVALWDALSSLGIEWGDGDFFHWENATDIGNDFLFSVGTSTPPGYFFPEEAMAGRLHAADLDFGFSLPRTHQPLAIFDAMMRAVRYVQRRLGGTIVDGDGAPLDEAALRERIRTECEAMTAAGIAPGSGAALLLF